MQASPGFIDAEPREPPVHVVPLVHLGGTLKGSLTPASLPVAQPVPGGLPVAFHVCSAAISAGVARVAGAGGMGAVALCIRVTAIVDTGTEGLLRAGAIRSA